jgi:DNA-binding MarR family transcriptional regulator
MARSDEIEDLYRQLNSLIRRSRELSHELHPELSLIAHTFLNLVDTTPEIQASDLVDRLGLDKSTVSRQLNQLFDRGPLGRRVLATDADRVRARVTGWLEDWDNAEIATFAGLIARFTTSLDQSLNP